MTSQPGVAVKTYLDGPEVGQDTTDIGASIWSSSSPLTIGAESYGNTERFAGNITDVRVSNNVRYTANFNVPTKPLESDSNTVGLWRLGS